MIGVAIGWFLVPVLGPRVFFSAGAAENSTAGAGPFAGFFAGIIILSLLTTYQGLLEMMLGPLK
jgi:hypothetical protein